MLKQDVLKQNVCWLWLWLLVAVLRQRGIAGAGLLDRSRCRCRCRCRCRSSRRRGIVGCIEVKITKLCRDDGVQILTRRLARKSSQAS